VKSVDDEALGRLSIGEPPKCAWMLYAGDVWIDGKHIGTTVTHEGCNGNVTLPHGITVSVCTCGTVLIYHPLCEW